MCQDYNDFQQLEPQVLNVEGTIGPLTKENKLGFDAGYSSASNCAFLEKKKLDGYIPTKGQAQELKGDNSTWPLQKYDYDPETNEIIADGLRFEYMGAGPDRGQTVHRFRNKETKKIKKLPKHFRAALRMRDKMEKQESRLIYKKRQTTVEPAIGNIKYNLAFHEFLLRGIDSVKTELNLACVAHNLKKVWLHSRKGARGLDAPSAFRQSLIKNRSYA